MSERTDTRKGPIEKAIDDLSNSPVSRRSFIGRSGGALLAVGGLGSFLSACGGSGSGGSDGAGGEVVVMTWGGAYIGKDVAAALKKRHNITLRAVPGESDADFFTKLKAGGGSQYDVVISNAGYAPLFHDNDLTEELDLSSFDSAKDLYPEFRENTELEYLLAPDKSLLYPNSWGVYGMTFNTEGEWMPSSPYSWNQLWEAPEGKVLLHGAPDEDIAVAGLAMGVPAKAVFAMTGSTLDEAKQRMVDLAPFQLSQSDDRTYSAFKSGRALAGSAFGLGVGPILNKEAGRDLAQSVVPSEGAVAALDGAQLVKGARNRENALKFIDFFGSKENQLFLWDSYRYAQCSKTAMEQVIKDGGEAAQFALDVKANQPDVVLGLAQTRQPDDPEGWAAAWDEIQAA